MLVGFFIGTVLSGALFLGPLRSATTRALEEEQPVSGSTTAEMDLSVLDVKLMLTTAAGEIKTEETRQFYQKLMESYDVDNFPIPTQEILDVNPVGLLPDLGRINRSAMTVPLEEAGKRIKDPDIANFYYKLLKDAGWNVQR
jgi:hypothetical protein